MSSVVQGGGGTISASCGVGAEGGETNAVEIVDGGVIESWGSDEVEVGLIGDVVNDVVNDVVKAEGGCKGNSLSEHSKLATVAKLEANSLWRRW